ncbi:hypothetical protein SPRG_10622 [Saprolegnia parasitica CBS 223.65]|uniref:Uncharacterized protein n=1 Tax=Saprolegnia parasitica (strain CBS 223.65) TaxID=695850 RepID=A0A067C127_SAPPC|nr:hypothetical protein SPRG_10622 [Saprolegnia parasitica CBS 223.65]KDO24193.1 hypothetical protein SPRG_10622 [Saprolegnia parasitica CBS 223.65]|eukprot:XP_012205137.1 hypothetical protein SPRG_10622 [Saprolegnia parasitica CBS 223.65]
MSRWDDLKREARVVERALDEKVNAYASTARSMSRTSRPFDEENPPQAADQNEFELGLEIEQFLSSLADIIDRMAAACNGSMAQEAVLQRYRELHFDFGQQFKRSASTIHESPMRKALPAQNPSVDPEAEALLRERGMLDASRTMANDSINIAMAVKENLLSQRAQLDGSRGKVTTVGSSTAGINVLVDQIRRKKMRNNILVALTIAGCICFTLWWTSVDCSPIVHVFLLATKTAA